MIMAKKSNKTSHVLNLLTNRTGLSSEVLEQSVFHEKAEMLPIEMSAEIPVDRPVDRPAEKKRELPQERPSVKVARNVSDLIRLNLEKFEIEEKARLSEKLSNRRIVHPVPQAAARTPRIEAYAPEAFNETEKKTEESEGSEDSEDAESEHAGGIAVAANEHKEEKIMSKPDETEEKIMPKQDEPMDHQLAEGGGKSMEGLILANILEEVMRLEAPKVMAGFGMCCCERCQNDVLALALNRMPPKYVVSKKGALFAKIASYGNQYKTDIFSNLTHACVVVKDSPSHG